MTLLKITQVWWCCAVLLLVSAPSLYGQYIKVDEADSQYVGKPLVKNDPAYADFNTEQIALIMMSAPKGATIYFPAGDYHFNGSAMPNRGTIESSQRGQIFRGDGVGTTRIIQHNAQRDFGFQARPDFKRVPAATLRVRHKGCRVEQLTIKLADQLAPKTIAGSAAISIAHIVYFPDHNVGIVETTGDSSTGNFLLDHVVVTNVDIGENHTGGILAQRFFEVGIDIQGSGGHIRVANVNRLDARTGIRLDNGNHCGQGEYQFESIYSMGNPSVFTDGVFFDWVGGQAPSIHNSSCSFTSGIFAGPKGKYGDRLNPYPEAIVKRRPEKDWDWLTIHDHYVVDRPDENQRREWYGLPRYSEIVRIGSQPRTGGNEWILGEDFVIEQIDTGAYQGAVKIIWKGERPSPTSVYYVTYRQEAAYRVHDLEWGNAINFSCQEANQVNGFAIKFDDQETGYRNPDFRFGIGYNFLFSGNFIINGNIVFNGHVDDINISGLTSGVCNIMLQGADKNRPVSRISVNNSTFNHLVVGDYTHQIKGTNNFIDNTYQIHAQPGMKQDVLLDEKKLQFDDLDKVELLYSR
ncbi:hypothetical protein [Parapedobacter sp. 10938]|uniref:hypothetical protein n=1 Tax=Parapedobacter flavus TaxID=3110225 RepID=UPI002DB956A2|nr:hypothetical protein [Parapedobacter sp. 10938]MEC3878506.1 hypothetical protein [Parapedobacter sp. 10938]